MHVESWLARAAANSPSRTAIEAPDGELSYAALLAAARAGARTLRERGVEPGQRVAIALPAGLGFAQALHACLLLGAVAVPVDLRLKDSERERIAAGAAALVEEPLTAASAPADRGTPSAAPKIGDSGRRPTTERPESKRPESERLESERLESERLDLDATAVVIHTSGTTSAPKPVELTYGNLLWSALGSAVALGLDPNERWLCALPLSHVGGLSILVRSAIYGTTAVVHERFETDRALVALREEGITVVSLVATTLARLLDGGLKDPPDLRCALTGGGPVSPALVDRAREAGVPVRETYGLTECCSQAATAPPQALTATVSPQALTATAPQQGLTSGSGLADAAVSRTPAGAGAPLFCTRVEIAPDGEILLTGPTVAPGASAGDGWLHTGDLGRLDERGFLHVTGRKADTIVTGGENVSPGEVEAAIETHPDVVEAAVLGRPDPDWGEAVGAIVVVSPGMTVGEDELRAHCAATLAPFKVPKRFTLVSEPLPRTASGKLLRRELR